MKKEYHEIFIPCTDVYSLGGSEVFKHLERKKEDEKNLVVIHDYMVEKLDNINDQNGNAGAQDVLKFLKKAKEKKISSKDGITTYNVLEGLDIAFIDDVNDSKENISVINLEEKVKNIWNAHHGAKPILLTTREKYHIKLDGRGLCVQDPEFLLVNSDIINDGIIMGNDELKKRLIQNKRKLSIDKASEILGRELYSNQFIKFVGSEKRDIKYEYAKVTGNLLWSGSRIVDVENPIVQLFDYEEYDKNLHVGQHYMDTVLGITPRDMEQYLALQHCIFNQEVSTFFLSGSQGSGKTLLSYAAAMDLILCYNTDIRKQRGIKQSKAKKGFFDQIILLKPTEIFGGKRRDIGYLPGNLYEKVKPHLGSYIDAHKESIFRNLFPFDQVLLHPKFENDFGGPRNKNLNDLKINNCAHLPKNRELVEMTYSGYIRGRSFRDTLILVDEGQNFTPYEMKTIMARLGEGCKVIIMGDPLQVDNPLCSREINGLTSAIKHYIDKPYSAQLNLVQNYRHQMSEDADSWRVFSS